MTHYEVYTLETAPEKSKPVLEKARAAFGFIPNLLGVMAESPSAVEGYFTLAGIFQNSSFSPLEGQVIAITTAVENGCHYCVAGHSTLATMRGLDKDVIACIREQREIADPRLEALHHFTGLMVRNRGFVSEADLDAFIAAGYTKAQAFEVVLGIAFKTMSNYINHIAHTPVDQAFAAAAWTPATRAAE